MHRMAVGLALPCLAAALRCNGAGVGVGPRHQGILWTQREQLRRALLYLLAAQDLYRQLDPLYPTAVSSGDAGRPLSHKS
jgi:hypothetical protein